jgi:hypothetical protein
LCARDSPLLPCGSRRGRLLGAPGVRTAACSPAGHREGDCRELTTGWGRRRRGDTTCGRVLVDDASVCLTCFRCLIRILQVFCVDVAKVDLDVSVLWMLTPDVATICFQMLRMLQTFIFRCCGC